MYILKLGYLCLLFVSVGGAEIIGMLRFLPEVQAAGKNYYVAPKGARSSCTQTDPCSLDIGLSKGAPGDEVVLLDGVYNLIFETKRGGSPDNPLTIRAENRHKAIISKDTGNITYIRHNYVVIRGIVFDGQKRSGSNGGIRMATGVHDVVFEDNIVRNMRASCVHITTGQYNVVVRHNLIDGCGYQTYWGEAFYIGNKRDVKLTVHDIEIYGNDVRTFTENGVDAKKYSKNIKIYHNIFSNQVTSQDLGSQVTSNRGYKNHGTIELEGQQIAVYNNILRDNKAGFGHFVIKGGAAHRVYKNVIYRDREPTDYAIRSLSWGGGNLNLGASEIYQNTFCNLKEYKIDRPQDLRIYDNYGIPDADVPQSACDVEVKRVLNEMQELRGADNNTTQLVNVPTPHNLRIRKATGSPTAAPR